MDEDKSAAPNSDGNERIQNGNEATNAGAQKADAATAPVATAPDFSYLPPPSPALASAMASAPCSSFLSDTVHTQIAASPSHQRGMPLPLHGSMANQMSSHNPALDPSPLVLSALGNHPLTPAVFQNHVAVVTFGGAGGGVTPQRAPALGGSSLFGGGATFTSESQPVTPRPEDVLFGRGQPLRVHPGNIHMRRLLDNNQAQYNAKHGREAKTAVTKSLVSQLKDGGSRFLKFDKTLGFWVQVSDTEARHKIAHAMRDRRRASSSLAEATAASGSKPAAHFNKSPPDK